MCSMAGIINFKKNLFTYEAYNRLLVRDMAQALSNTKAMKFCEWVGEHAAFSHSHSSEDELQPLKKTVEGHEFVIICNGKLRNSDELKKILMKFGYTFTTNLDAEVLLYSYIHYGEECCKKPEGNYCFCVWDSMRQQVFICCDKAGSKPFFYAKTADSVIFASDVKSLFRYPDFIPKIDKNGICELFAFFPLKTTDANIFKDVIELSPATCVIINRSGIFEKQYCNPEKNISNPHLNTESRIKVLKPIIAETLNLGEYSKMRYKNTPYPHITTTHLYNFTVEKNFNEILEDQTSPINVFIDRENALSIPELIPDLIKINEFLKEFNPIII